MLKCNFEDKVLKRYRINSLFFKENTRNNKKALKNTQLNFYLKYGFIRTAELVLRPRYNDSLR